MRGWEARLGGPGGEEEEEMEGGDREGSGKSIVNIVKIIRTIIQLVIDRAIAWAQARPNGLAEPSLLFCYRAEPSLFYIYKIFL